MCLKEGVIRKADITDHVQELRDRWDLRLDESNYMSLCHSHHNLKTRQEKARRATLNR
ncbi:HNH endonuclease [Enterococcus dongliensis]|uniref:HNH endonuclease n=2 Tax=Enterococcus TaxID=1350 RepID=A0ABU3ESC3_9ENTE|nr:HNH endonuclease [Enterococcus avium]MDT2597763.1 HNH endonuclease [Enterococcus dongliensis]